MPITQMIPPPSQGNGAAYLPGQAAAIYDLAVADRKAALTGVARLCLTLAQAGGGTGGLMAVYDLMVAGHRKVCRRLCLTLAQAGKATVRRGVGGVRNDPTLGFHF